MKGFFVWLKNPMTIFFSVGMFNSLIRGVSSYQYLPVLCGLMETIRALHTFFGFYQHTLEHEMGASFGMG